jgi:hypothetical protein
MTTEFRELSGITPPLPSARHPSATAPQPPIFDPRNFSKTRPGRFSYSSGEGRPARNEWKFFAVLPKADRPLAVLYGQSSC